MTKARDIADAIINTAELADNAVTNAKMADDSVGSAELVDNSVGAAAFNISGNGTSGQVIVSDGDGSFSYANQADPFQPTTVSGTTQTMDLSSDNFFDGGTLSGNTTLVFSNVPTAKLWSYVYTAGFQTTTYDFAQTGSVGQEVTSSGGSLNIAAQCYPIISSDGTKMLILGNTGDGGYVDQLLVEEYNLTSAYSLTTLTHADEFTESGAYRRVRGAFAKPDDRKIIGLYYSDATNNYTLFSYDFTADFDVSTKGSIATNNILTGISDTYKGLTFNNDGTKMYICENTNNVQGWTLSSAYDVSTASRATSLDSGSLGISPEAMSFNSDGSIGAILLSGSIKIYALSTAYDWSTQSLSSTVSVSSLISTDDGHSISSDGKYFYIGSGARNVQRRSLEGQNIYTLTYPSSVQNPNDIVSSNDAGDKYKIEFITTDGGTNVFKTGHNKYIDN
jgi:hypothetical protein